MKTLALLVAFAAFPVHAESLWGRGGVSSGDSSSSGCSSCVLLTGDQTVAGVKTFSSAITSSVASGSNAINILTSSRIGLITGGADYLTCDGTVCNMVGTNFATTTGKITSADDVVATTDFIGRTISITGGATGFNGIARSSAAWLSAELPTLSGNWCTSATRVGSMIALDVTVGTSCTGKTGGIITVSRASSNGFFCRCVNFTQQATQSCRMTAKSTTTATFENYTTATGVAADLTDNDHLLISCIGY